MLYLLLPIEIQSFLCLVYYSSEHPEAPSYHRYYYINTLTRASPFFVGMIFGYVIHISRQRRIQIKKVQLT